MFFDDLYGFEKFADFHELGEFEQLEHSRNDE